MWITKLTTLMVYILFTFCVSFRRSPKAYSFQYGIKWILVSDWVCLHTLHKISFNWSVTWYFFKCHLADLHNCSIVWIPVSVSTKLHLWLTVKWQKPHSASLIGVPRVQKDSWHLLYILFHGIQQYKDWSWSTLHWKSTVMGTQDLMIFSSWLSTLSTFLSALVNKC